MTLPAVQQQGLGVGIHDGVPMRDYMLHHGLSASRLHTILTQSPFHALHDTGGEPSEASEIGTAIHDALLEGVYRLVPLAFDDYKKQAARDARDEARAANKIPILERKLPQIQAATDAATRFISVSEIAGVFDSGKPEQTIIWKEGDLICKARPDWLTDDRSIMLHLKTTQGSAEPSSWIRNQLVPAGYDVSAEFYARGLAEFAGIGFNDFKSVFLVIEQAAPYGCSLIGLDPAMQDLASRKVDRGIRIWQQCKASGKYPSYPTRIHYAEPFAWQMAAEEAIEFGPEIDPIQLEQGLQI